jgi:small GTP-binding protein
MLQKKICMVGVYGTGKTCLVQRYVHSIFSARYLSTVGVKIDRKEIALDGSPVMLLLWDLEGRDHHHDVNTSYLRGAHGIIYVVDGTRRETYDQMFEIRGIVSAQLGEIPSVVAVNKIDLTADWRLTPADESAIEAQGMHRIRTSAKTGEGVEPMFEWLARAAVGGNGAGQ